MPRPEDIAWKFVVRLDGKRWRCPYCHKESSGSVTRVKSHFLKQPKEGIASCTKVPEHIRTLMELLLNHELHNKDDIAWKFVNRVEDSKWRCYYCSGEFFGDLTKVKGHLLGVPNEGISICTGVPNHVRTLMWSLLDAVAEEESRGANGQSSMEPQSRHMLTQLSPSFSPETLEYLGPLLPTPRGATNMENFTQQGVIGSNSDQQSQAHRQFHQSSAMLLLGQSSHVQPALVPHQDQSVLHQSINHETRDMQWNATMPLDNLDTTQQPDLHDFPPENLVEYCDVIVNSPEEIQMNEQHNLTVGSSLQNDLSPDVDSTNRLQDCSRPCVGEGVSGLSNTSPTNAVQHPDQLHPRCDWEGGNDTRFVPSPTPVDVNCFLALPHSSDSLDNLHVVEAATNAIGSSSSQDLNRGYPIMTAWSINANDEEIRNLKRKVEELNGKEAVIKEQMEIESAASSVRKKPRILVEGWLKETERARNNFQIIGQANGETLPPKEQVETLTREVEELIEQALPQTLLIEERDAKGVKFLEREELIEQALPQTLLIEERDAKGVKFLERKLIGEAIHGNIEFIWGHLKKNRACKLGIYGMGGVGKTTIMKLVHNRLLEDATFDGVVFVTVSKDFSISKLQIDIGKALKFDVKESEDEEKRASILAEYLEKKKNCVLILDDVWEHFDLEEVGFPVRAHGFKFILTTRSFDVCRRMQCQEIKIEPLSLKEAESLFFEELGSKVALDLETKTIVNSIVKECAGLPIGVITMARSMRGVTDMFEWRDSLLKLKDSCMEQTYMEKKVLMKLKFSYDRLGNPNVQQCFLSCALYPEDELIDKFELVEFFIDQELIGGLNTRREQYDRGLTIVNNLKKVCLLEDHGSYVKMHDLIRDMALHIMSATSIVKARKRLESIPSEEYWTDALEKVSLMRNSIREFPLNMSPNCPKLSTLLLDSGLSLDARIPDSFFQKLWGLKVLNLSVCDLRELPNSISNLVNLRALLLCACWNLRRIPYLEKLTSLRKLDVSGCESLEALEGLEMLMNLRYLALSFSLRGRLPKGVLGGLLNLQHLKFGLLDGEDITKLRALEKLECYFEDADDFNKCVRVIEQVNPQYYYLCMYKIFIDNEIFIEIEHDDAVPLQRRIEKKVKIVMWSHAIVSMEGECTGIFILIPRDVKALRGTQCNGITNFSDIGPLDYLEELEIYDWENLGVLCGGRDEEVIDIRDSPATTPPPTPLLFPRLRVLRIEECPKLKYLSRHGFKSNFPHLREILIVDCEEMVGIIAAATSPPPHPPLAFPSLERISVHQCHKMKRVVEFEWMPHFPNLRRIDVLACSNMEEIIGGPPPHLPAEKISLEYLSTFNCSNMRKLFPHEWLLHLRNLQEIYVSHCEGMVEMISGAGQGQEGSIMTPANNTLSSFQSSISLPNLKQLDLYELPQLKSICEVPISCGSMDNLKVYKCPELKEIPLQLRLRDIDIKNLPHIWVDDEKKWKTLKWDDPNAQAILQPYLQKGEHVNRPLLHECQIPPDAIELNTKGKDLW